MKKLTVLKKDYCNYTFLDEDNNEYKIFIELMNTDLSIDLNDTIYIHNELLDKNYKEYSTMYTFGSLGSKYAREVKKENYIDIIVLIKNNKKNYLQRYYG